jgi:uncharacterized protein
MFVGIARLVLHVPESRSLKDRRRVVKSLKDRLRARLPVSVAEVGDVERHQVAELGVVTVSGEAHRCEEVLASVVNMGSTLHDALLTDSSTRVIPYGVER